jgi:hypothetical protein
MISTLARVRLNASIDCNDQVVLAKPATAQIAGWKEGTADRRE